jgi:hypothetical protein
METKTRHGWLARAIVCIAAGVLLCGLPARSQEQPHPTLRDRYNFKRLDGNIDYQVWVLFRGHRSATRSISMFDSHMAKVIDFTVRTY